jgi:hypothetical protein
MRHLIKILSSQIPMSKCAWGRWLRRNARWLNHHPGSPFSPHLFCSPPTWPTGKILPLSSQNTVRLFYTRRLSSVTYLYASVGYVNIVHVLLGVYMWAYLVLTHTRNFFHLRPVLLAGRSSWASVSISPSSPGNGSFARHFWYVFLTTSGGAEQPIDGWYCQLYLGARWCPLVAIILEMLGEEGYNLNCQAWIKTLTFVRWNRLTELPSSHISPLSMWVDFLVPMTSLSLRCHEVVHIFRILICIIAGRSSHVSGRLRYVHFWLTASLSAWQFGSVINL